MLQLKGGQWPKIWEPHGWADGKHEPLEGWLERCASEFPGLDPRVLEQWVYRHWAYSPYFGFPLQRFESSLQRFTTAALLTLVGENDCWENPVYDQLESFYREVNQARLKDLEPWRTMNRTGSWMTPVLLLRSPNGFAFNDRLLPEFSFWLIEGHRRRDYLRALDAKGLAARDHEVLVLNAIN